MQSPVLLKKKQLYELLYIYQMSVVVVARGECLSIRKLKKGK
jgi:hypothetical protein